METMERYPRSVLKLLHSDDFVQYVENIREFGEPLKKAYDRAERLFFVYFDTNKFCSYDSFYRAYVKALGKPNRLS